MSNVISVFEGNTLLALILPSSYKAEGIQFFTPDTFSQQLGYMNRPKGYLIAPHDHNPVSRTIQWTQEVLLIRSGKVRLDIYATETRKYLESHVLCTGDVALLAHGGHGLEILEQAEIIEVKQGPYAGEADKTRFTAVNADMVCIRS